MRLPKKLWRMAGILIEYRLRREAPRNLPLRLWIETSSSCNLRCIMCPNKDVPGARKGLMKIELFRKIIDEMAPFVGDIYLHHRGEPLLNPALFDMIKYARDAGIKTRFHTNGVLLNQERAEKLLEAQPDLVSFSVDGFTKESYENIRQGAAFEKTVANILYFAQKRRALGLKTPYTIIEKIHFINPELNVETEKTLALREKFMAAGVDEIIEKEEYVWAEESVPETAPEKTLNVCTFPWYAMTICYDGTVTPCPQDFHAVLKMGNANENTLREIWHGEAYRDLRRRFKTDIQSLALCRKCDRLRRPMVAGVPIQYMITFLTDQLLGYSRWRKKLGAHERNKK